MYSYDFVFYKPGKKFYTQEEVLRLNNSLTMGGFELEGKWTTKEKVEHVDLHLEKSGQTFFFHLGPAQEEIHGVIGGLSIPEEQFEEDPEKSAELMEEGAGAIFEGLKPLFAWGDHELELSKLEPFLRFDRIGALAWANVFSRELVERLGGLDKVLLFPDKEKKYQGKEWLFATVYTSATPTEAMPARVALECEYRYPGAILRGFEIPPLKGIERVR